MLIKHQLRFKNLFSNIFISFQTKQSILFLFIFNPNNLTFAQFFIKSIKIIKLERKENIILSSSQGTLLVQKIMIINLTQQFQAKFKQYQTQKSQHLQKQQQQQKYFNDKQISNKSPNSKNKTQQKNPSSVSQSQHKIPLQYQLSLKYAKDVYLTLNKIQQILITKKDNYFSNAAYSLSSFTNQQRNEFDQQTKQALKSCSDQIDQLRITSETIKQGGMCKLKSKITYDLHLEEVILCLHQYFRKLENEFGEFLKYNEIKKKKILSTLSIQREDLKHHAALQQAQYFEKRNTQQNSSQPINPQLQRQSHQFYLQKVQDQKKALQTKQTIQSINTILQQMSKKVLDQQLLTSSFSQIGSIGLKFIDQGNKNLIEANNLSKQTGKYWMLLFLGLAFSLLFVDFLKS